jgi:hypothetical protein
MAVKTVKKPAVEIKISDVLNLLESGKTRPEIAKHYDLNLVQVAELFRHNKLRGKKTKKIASDAFTLIDDAPDAPISNIPTTRGAESNGNPNGEEAPTGIPAPQPVQSGW